MDEYEIEEENLRRLKVLENYRSEPVVQPLVDLLVASIDDQKVTGSLADTAFAQEVIRAVVLSRISQFRQFSLGEVRAVTLYFDTPEILISKLAKKRRIFDRQMSRLQEFMDDHGDVVRNSSYWFCAELGATANGKVLVHAHGLVSGDYVNLVDEYLRRNELISKSHRTSFKMTPLRCTAANASDMPENEQRDYAVGKWTAYALKLTTHQKISTKNGERSIRRVPMKPNEEIAMLRFYNKQRLIL